MKDYIYKRKSIRKYDPAALDETTLEKVRAQIGAVWPLYPDIQYSIEIVSRTKGPFNIKAPHYLILGSEDKEGALENIGFIGQQMDLSLSASGLGSCWCGAAKPEEKEASPLPHAITIAFGNPNESLYRELSDFKRKPLAEISQGDDSRIEAARLAPSAVNAQSWFFAAGDGKIHCYRKKSAPLLGSIYNRLHCIDMGIALCHIALVSSDFRFSKDPDAPGRKGHVYVGTVGP